MIEPNVANPRVTFGLLIWHSTAALASESVTSRRPSALVADDIDRRPCDVAGMVFSYINSTMEEGGRRLWTLINAFCRVRNLSVLSMSGQASGDAWPVDDNVYTNSTSVFLHFLISRLLIVHSATYRAKKILYIVCVSLVMFNFCLHTRLLISTWLQCLMMIYRMCGNWQ